MISIESEPFCKNCSAFDGEHVCKRPIYANNTTYRHDTFIACSRLERCRAIHKALLKFHGQEEVKNGR